METITLADGTVIENAHVSESDGRCTSTSRMA